jgi:hypothetical protein
MYGSILGDQRSFFLLLDVTKEFKGKLTKNLESVFHSFQTNLGKLEHFKDSNTSIVEELLLLGVPQLISCVSFFILNLTRQFCIDLIIRVLVTIDFKQYKS